MSECDDKCKCKSQKEPIPLELPFFPVIFVCDETEYERVCTVCKGNSLKKGDNQLLCANCGAVLYRTRRFREMEFGEFL